MLIGQGAAGWVGCPTWTSFSRPSCAAASRTAPPPPPRLLRTLGGGGGEVACLRLALGHGLVASTLDAAVQAVPGQLRFLLTRATASCAHALVVGAVHLLPVDISGLARLWASQSPGKGAGRLTEPPLDTSLNSEAGEADGIEGVPFPTGIPTVRGWSGG
jgi:hypothetical protein